MPVYLIVHTERRGDDTLIEDDNLTVEFTNGWPSSKTATPSTPTASSSPSPPHKSPASNG